MTDHNGMNINEAADKLGVSTRTIRRYIKSGKIQAHIINGHFGEEYRIPELPEDLLNLKTGEAEKTPPQPPPHTGGHSLVQAVDIIRELQEKNMTLAAQLGVATERVRNLEEKLKLLAPPPHVVSGKPWWKRMLAKWAE